jgi:hypothetical protein
VKGFAFVHANAGSKLNQADWRGAIAATVEICVGMSLRSEGRSQMNLPDFCAVEAAHKNSHEFFYWNSFTRFSMKKTGRVRVELAGLVLTFEDDCIPRLLELADHFAAVASDERLPDVCGDVFTNAANGSIHQQRIDDSHVPAAGSHGRIGHCRGRGGLLCNGYVVDIHTVVDDICIGWECPGEGRFVDFSIHPLGMA